MIKVLNLTKKYGENVAVDSLSFAVSSGEIVGFLGPNGAGKTTTMRMISGYLSPDEGSIHVNKISVADDPVAAQLHIGYLPENNPLYKDMLVSDFLNLSSDLKKIPQKEKKKSFEFVVSAVAISDVFYRPIGELSKGYKQRVGLAAALLHKPKVLLLDEPTEGLDPTQRNEIRQLIRELSKNHTIMMSTHVMQEVSAVCSRVLIIHKGKLVADGTPQDLGKQIQGDTLLVFEVEGENVESSLKALEGVKHLEIQKISPKRIRAEILSNPSVELQPELSRLSEEHKWIIWKLNEEGKGLEDIFHILTKENP
ncbi:ATP-binding cassette domain-containing protein [Candidatus Peregrinibacteria bacterium]|nr:ATP-binding cassette domain-containing protein [Candidatus Peregrinibacteria bacterium]